MRISAAPQPIATRGLGRSPQCQLRPPSPATAPASEGLGDLDGEAFTPTQQQPHRTAASIGVWNPLL